MTVVAKLLYNHTKPSLCPSLTSEGINKSTYLAQILQSRHWQLSCTGKWSICWVNLGLQTPEDVPVVSVHCYVQQLSKFQQWNFLRLYEGSLSHFWGTVRTHKDFLRSLSDTTPWWSIHWWAGVSCQSCPKTWWRSELHKLWHSLTRDASSAEALLRNPTEWKVEAKDRMFGWPVNCWKSTKQANHGPGPHVVFFLEKVHSKITVVVCCTTMNHGRICFLLVQGLLCVR